MVTSFSIELLLTLLHIDFHQVFLIVWISRHLIACFDLLSPLIIVLLNINNDYKIILPVFLLLI